MSGAASTNTRSGATVDSLIGRTVRWTFEDGPVAGKTYEHTFNADGSVVYRSIEGANPGKITREMKCAVDSVGGDVVVISYLAASGYTLTVILDFRDHRMVGFASNEKEWYRQQGTFELCR
jgi:hypothetical protein